MPAGLSTAWRFGLALWTGRLRRGRCGRFGSRARRDAGLAALSAQILFACQLGVELGVIRARVLELGLELRDALFVRLSARRGVGERLRGLCELLALMIDPLAQLDHFFFFLDHIREAGLEACFVA